MSELIDRAKLTKEERANLPDFEHEHNWTWCDACEQYVADCATAKALGVMLVWLGTWDECQMPSDDCVCVRLRAEMDAAGIKQPEEAI